MANKSGFFLPWNCNVQMHKKLYITFNQCSHGHESSLLCSTLHVYFSQVWSGKGRIAWDEL